MPAIDGEAVDRLVAYADGDARRLLNTLETLAVAAGAEKLDSITDAWLLRVLGEQLRRYDKGGEQFYDTISALHKSVRGSDPDAALYWFVRMLDGGADPRYMARRLVRMASEDIGLADPRALRLALDAAEVYERLGSPEGELALAEAWSTWRWRRSRTRSTRPTTRSGLRQVRTARGRCRMHLRNAPTRLMKQLDYGKGYRYAHDEEGGFAAGENYLPEGLDAPALLPRRWSADSRSASRKSCANCESATRSGQLIAPVSRPILLCALRHRTHFQRAPAGKPRRNRTRSAVARDYNPAHKPAVDHMLAGFLLSEAQASNPERRVSRAPLKGAAQKKGFSLWTSCCSRSSTVWFWAACTP